MKQRRASGALIACVTLISAATHLQATAIHTFTQAQSGNRTSSQPEPAAAIDDEIDAGESANDEPKRRLIKWNEYEGPLFTIRVGGGYLYDYVAFTQDENSKEQVDVEDQWKLRDARVLFSG